jgi:undecaprenyl-diphosphatase
MILIPYAMIIGFSRMYLALHYPTDVLIGTFLGSSFAFIVVNLFERI